MKLSLRFMAAMLTMILATNISFAQTSGVKRSNIEPLTIAKTPLGKNDQWHNLRRWVALTFDNSNVIDMQDQERGTMVIKWSCPVTMPSDYVNATAIMTYVIDVRDGKYRIQRLNPRISYQLIRPDFYDELDGDRVGSAASDIKFITEISRRIFGGASEWPVDERYADVIQTYFSVASSTPQYRNDRDREKGKVNDDWRRAERNWRLLNQPVATLAQLDASMTASLDQALTQNDDF